MTNITSLPQAKWACFRPDGELVDRTIADSKEVSMHWLCGSPVTEDSKSWKQHKKKGYRCLPITITVAPDDHFVDVNKMIQAAADTAAGRMLDSRTWDKAPGEEGTP